MSAKLLKVPRMQRPDCIGETLHYICAHVESILEDVMGFRLHFPHPEECHPQQVLLGTLEHDGVCISSLGISVVL